MAARRFSPQHDARTREKIKTSQLINRLNAFVLGENEVKGDQKGNKKVVEMSAQQVAAALGLLKKTLPDLSAIQHAGDPDSPLEIIKREIIGKKPDDKDG